jgi:hypothetical protein
MEKHLSVGIKAARSSRLIDGPESQNIAADPGGFGTGHRNDGAPEDDDTTYHVEGRPDMNFGHPDALTLDDIPRIVAAEQAKEQRPNAYKHARNQILSPGREPKLQSQHHQHQRDINGSQDEGPNAQSSRTPRAKRYFSDLSALEYFIVRTIAVLELQTLLEGQFNAEELMSLVESTRKPSFWDKVGKVFKNDKPKGIKKKGVFGVSLDILVERDGTETNSGVGSSYFRIPTLLEDSINAMRQMDMSVEGVFRKNGNIRGLKVLEEKIDAKEDVDLSKENPVQVAALLKRFLRSMPDPLLTHNLYDLFNVSQSMYLEMSYRSKLTSHRTR